MLELLTINLIYIGIVMGLLAISWLSNFALSLYYNIKILSEPFDWTRIWNGIQKLIALVVGTALLVVAITFVPIFLQYVNIPIPDEYVTLLSVLTIVAIFMKSIYTYIKQAYETLNGILDFKK